jgi:tRNA(Ile)-lysidine synthase
VRYEAFAEEAGRAAAKRGANPDMVRIALAHNRGDLSETVLMRIIRGTGPDGLSGISALRDGEGGYGIIRPLIDSSRTEIEEYCSFRGLNPRIDSTNEKTDYLRNSVRLELLPTLREKYNPSVDDALARLSRAAAESRDYFDTVVGETIEKEGEFAGESGSAGPSSADFPLDTLKRSHPAIRHRLILGIFGKIGLTQDIGASHIAAADDIIEGGRTGKYIDLPKGYRFGISYEKTVFTSPIAESDDSERPDDEKRSFAIAIADIGKATGNITIFEGSGFPIEAEVKDYDGTLKSGAALVLDYEALSSEAAILQLRSKLDGDRICPPGIDGSKKLQDIFVDKKIPREKRSNIPVISTENEVLWIPGIRRTRLYEPNSATKRVIVLSQQ